MREKCGVFKSSGPTSDGESAALLKLAARVSIDYSLMNLCQDLHV